MLTDPPYNVAYEGGTGEHLTIQNDNLSGAQFREFLVGAFSASASVLKAGASFYVWYASRETVNFNEALTDAKLEVRQQIIWNKNAFTLGRQDYQWKHEPCLYGWKDGAAHYFADSRKEATVIADREELDIKKMKKEELQETLKQILSQKVATSVINEDKPTRNAEHPTMKPVKLFGYLVRNSTQRGERVLDVFGGSGTTLMACEQLGRKCYTMELDPHYCDVIIARWEKFTGKQARKIE